MLRCNFTREHHTETLKVEKNVFMVGQTLHEELAQIMQPYPPISSQFFVFCAKKNHIPLDNNRSKQSYRSKKKPRLIHLRMFLNPGTMEQVFIGLGPYSCHVLGLLCWVLRSD